MVSSSDDAMYGNAIYHAIYWKWIINHDKLATTTVVTSIKIQFHAALA